MKHVLTPGISRKDGIRLKDITVDNALCIRDRGRKKIVFSVAENGKILIWQKNAKPLYTLFKDFKMILEIRKKDAEIMIAENIAEALEWLSE